MEPSDKNLWDLVEKQKIMIDVLFGFVQDKDKTLALSQVAERIRYEITHPELKEQRRVHN